MPQAKDGWVGKGWEEIMAREQVQLVSEVFVWPDRLWAGLALVRFGKALACRNECSQSVSVFSASG